MKLSKGSSEPVKGRIDITVEIMKETKRTKNINTEKTTQKTMDWTSRTRLLNGSELMCCGWICSSRSTGVASRVIHANNTIISLILWQVLKRGEKDEIVTKKDVYMRNICVNICDTDLVTMLLELEFNLFVVTLCCQPTVWLCVCENMKQT